jgi:predicted DNA-binding protein with PD1-like motif
LRSAADSNLIIAKLEDGEDLLDSLHKVVKEHRIESGTVLWGIGMLRDFEVGYFDGKSYHRKTFGPPHELLALHGSIAARADPVFHLHVAGAGEGHGVVGGHLFKATVSTLSEVCLARFDRVRLGRELSPRSGLRELVVEPERPGAGTST